MQACIDHARDLIESAKVVQASGKPNIAYHLAALALEEIGRRELIGFQTMANTMAIVPPAWPTKHAQNHVQKMFWAFFGGIFRTEKITKGAFEELKGLAEHIHARRIAGLYVDTEDGLNVPSKAIPPDETSGVISLVESRLGLAATEGERRTEATKEDLEIQNWFLAANEDEEKSKIIFSDVSRTKLAEFGGDARRWIEWLKGEFDAAQAAASEIVKRELEKTSAEQATAKPKWKIRFRLYSDAMSVPPKNLNWWNDRVAWIRILPVTDKNHQREVIVQITLNDNILLGQLWAAGSTYVRMFVAALNIGTRAFWWFHLPRQTSRFYERIEDLENSTDVKLDRAGTKIEWAERLVLNESALQQTMYQMSAVQNLFETPNWQAVEFYLGGLTFLSLNEIHWPCEIQAYENFHSSLKVLMRSYGGWDGVETFDEAYVRLVAELAPQMPPEQLERIRTIACAYEANSPDGVNVTVSEVAFAKVICDSYFARSVAPAALKATMPHNSSGTTE